MTQTYTEPIQTVSDGDTVTYETTDAADNLEILNAECRWRGINRTETRTVTDYASNQNYDQATATTSTDTKSRLSSVLRDSSKSISTFPSVASGYSFSSHELNYIALNKESNSVTVDLLGQKPDGSNFTTTRTISADSSITLSYSSNTNHVGQTVSFQQVNGDNNLEFSTICETIGQKTTTQSRTASTSYPSVPNGYSFDRHREEKSNGTDNFHYDNRVGQSESITSFSTSDTVSVRLTTRGKDTSTVTDTFNTENPSVSGDAFASYSGTLNDGEWSPWVQLSGFTEGQNSLTQDINGSFDADFELRYEWQFTVPDTLAEHRFVINGTTYVTALADPTDEAVQYDFYRTYIDGEGIVCYDVVDVDDADASPYRIYHPTHGVKALRDKS